MWNQCKHLNALNQVAINMITKLLSDMNMLQRKRFRQYTLSKGFNTITCSSSNKFNYCFRDRTLICTFLYKAACGVKASNALSLGKVSMTYLNQNQTLWARLSTLNGLQSETYLGKVLAVETNKEPMQWARAPQTDLCIR